MIPATLKTPLAAARNQNGSVEILLLLCCTVGVVAFMCFSISAINLGIMAERSQVPPFGEEKSGMDELRMEERNKSAYLDLLQQQIADYRRRVAENERSLAAVHAPQAGKDNVKKFAARVNELQAKLAEKESELAEYSKRSTGQEEDFGTRKADKRDLERRLREVQEELTSEKERLGQLRSIPPSGAERDADSLRKLVESEDVKIRELDAAFAKKKAECSSITVTGLFGGSTMFANPLLLECKAGQIVVHPDGTTIDQAEFEAGDPLASLTKEHDGLVLLIRPSGFDVFGKAIGKARATGLKIAYEPVDADLNIDFGKAGGS